MSLMELHRASLDCYFFSCTTAVLAVALVWFVAPRYFQSRINSEVRFDEDIVFPGKSFLSTKAYVAVKGTLVGDWLAHKNNTYSILCIPEECIVAGVNQIGSKHIDSIDGPIVYPVKRWTDEEVVAEDDTLCGRITITFGRKTETVLWVETPINQTEIACRRDDNTIRKATIETSLYWRKRGG